MSRITLLLASLVATSLLPACGGKVLDVGTANRSAASAGEVDGEEPSASAGKVDGEEPSTSPPAQPGASTPTATPVSLDELAGVWAMTRQDGVFGEEYPGPIEAIELEITTSGAVYLSRCARAMGEVATAPCSPAAAFDCSPGTIAPEGDRWRVDIEAIRVRNLPVQGETVLLSDGRLLVRYIHPTFSAGYFSRIGTKDQTGGCPR